jgi:hypothetical protein
MSVLQLHRNSPAEKLIAYCASPPSDQVLGGLPYGNKVVKLSDGTAVKFGIGVTKDEAENQSQAHDLVDPRVVRIPRVDRFFSDERGLGYIVMEYIDGRIIDPLEDATSISKIACVLDYFATLHGHIPGALNGGPSRGLVFPDTESLIFSNTQSMEEWFNSRLFEHQPKLSLRGCELVLCHLDIAPRNILWLDNDDICLVDWASAGYYPRLFEFCTQWIMQGRDGKFNALLVDSMQSLPEDEMAQKTALLQARWNMQKYSL